MDRPADIQAMIRSFPAKFSEPILDAIEREIADRMLHTATILDPFGGVGGVHKLAERLPVETWAVDIEPEFAACHPRTVHGDSLRLRDVFYEHRLPKPRVIVTSPCLEQSHRLLTDDLRWVSCGDIEVGDRLLAFNENPVGTTVTGRASRRKWERSDVVRSDPMTVECVRVILANGEEVITTPNHPWLANRIGYTGYGWIESQDLLGLPGRNGGRSEQRAAAVVQRQIVPWVERRSYDAGWLAGMFDGEGHLSLGTHGNPQLLVSQVEGPVLDHAERLMESFGYRPNRITRPSVGGRRKVGNLYVAGGFPGILTALGELRPHRLLANWARLDMSLRAIRPEPVQVVAVESAGLRDIQGIETTSGTYIGDGYLMHNTYGNRLADQYLGSDDEKCRNCSGLSPTDCPKCEGTGKSKSKRFGYAITLGRKCTPGSGAAMPWGDRYRRLHSGVWAECARVLDGEGWWMVNVSSFIGGGEYKPVMEWHVEEIAKHAEIVKLVAIPTARIGMGQNADARVPVEHLIVAKH